VWSVWSVVFFVFGIAGGKVNEAAEKPLVKTFPVPIL